MSIAISRIKKEGVKIAHPDINSADFGFVPDESNNQIVFGLKGINSINSETAQLIIKNRPYTSFEDFCTRMIDTKLIKHCQMLMLIKAGCFLKLDDIDKSKTMKKYLSNYKYKPVEHLTLSQLSKIKEFEILPESLHLNLRVINFKDYVLHPDGFVRNVINDGKKVPKCGYHDRLFALDKNAQDFFTQYFTEDSVVEVNKDGYYIISEKKFVKEVDTLLQPLKEWFSSEEAVNAYNKKSFDSVWEESASGSKSKWSMQALTFYDEEHELEHINEKELGVINFFEQPEESEAYDYYTRYIDGVPKEMPKYKIVRVCGTVLNADANHHVVSLLTKYGVVNVKFGKEQYAFYNRRISQPNGKGGKEVVEESWFKRGTLLIAAGYRRGDQFALKTYADSVWKHTINKITSINGESVEVQVERTKV